MVSTIQQLSQLIAKSVTDLVDITSKNGFQLPELDDKLTPASEAFRQDANAAKAANVIAAAAIQLIACVLPPQESVIQITSGHMKSAALRVSIQCHVAEILRDAGPEGMHVDKIASKTGVDGTKLARLLRSLANRHIFREVKPDYFTNNRISGALDTGKSIDEILRNPNKKHDETSGFLAIAELNLTTCHKASSYLYENMKDPVTAFSEESTQAPVQRALRTEKNLFNWMSEPEHASELHTFGMAMKGSAALIPNNLLLDLFDWNSLPKGSTVVDVGGGIGSSCEILYRAHPELRYVVQDLPATVEDGRKHWALENAKALASGHITFQGHDFFTPQPPNNASVFLIKSVIHNWSDQNASKILTHLRNVAQPDTVLLLCDIVMTYSCREPIPESTEEYTIVNDPSLIAPDLLSTGFNSVNDVVWLLDAAVLLLVSTQERTIAQFKHLLSGCGWKIVKITRKGSSLDSIQAVPI
ncbi:O-methyltransferase [Collybia nuda]|uniref:O-methyltransferase n=1 Tax=Collybia nuda TaxID=64659 RepID=A0A9P5XXQ3_9AGAR|nr:O-methyltransferase [Collybia nuda]